MTEYRKTFKGGFSFRNLSGAPGPDIEKTPLPARVIIPLKQGYGCEVLPTVKPQEEVKAGQVIGYNFSAIASPVHSSVNGTVEQITTFQYQGEEIGAIVINSDGSDGWTKLDEYFPNFEEIDSEKVGHALYMAGVTSLGPSGFPTKHTSSSAKPENITDIIINAVNTEPYLPTNELLLKDNIDNFITGIKVLRRALPQANVHIGINKQDGAIINKLALATRRIDWLRVHVLKPKYPQEHETLLTNTILGKVVPYGGHAADIGVTILDVQAVLHAYDAVIEGKPVIERIVTLGGPAFKENVAVRVRVGTPVEQVLANRFKEGIDKRVLLGGIMTGIALDDLSLPICRATSSIAALEEYTKREFLTFIRPGVNRHSFSYTFLSAIFPSWKKRSETNLHGELRPCVACTFCTDACPVDMMPHLLSNYIKYGPLEETLKLKIHACIDCGLCTYVCPAKIPLMADIQEGRKRIMEEAEEEAKQ